MNIALVYCLAVLLALAVAAPMALLAPILFAVSFELPAEDYAPREVAAVVSTVQETAAPFVKVYAARGQSRPTVHQWSTCAAKPLALHTDRNAMPLRGAARRASVAKAGKVACTSHACPVVRR